MITLSFKIKISFFFYFTQECDTYKEFFLMSEYMDNRIE